MVREVPTRGSATRARWCLAKSWHWSRNQAREFIFSFSSPRSRLSKPLTCRRRVNGSARITASKVSECAPPGASKLATMLPSLTSSADSALPELHLDLVLERGQQGLDERRRATLDAKDFIALAEHLKRRAQIGADEVHHIEARLIFRLQPEFDVVGHIEQIDRPVVGLAAELLQIGLQAHLVELARVIRPILLGVGKLLGVFGDLLGDRHEGARLLFRVEHVLRRVECATEKIEIFAVAFGGELLHLHAEFAAELLQILMIGVHKLAAELAEHALIEIVLGEHASAPTIARFKHNRLRAGGLETIGRGQPGNAAADDGD